MPLCIAGCYILVDTEDLAVFLKIFSRMWEKYFVFHGTVFLGFPAATIGRLLVIPVPAVLIAAASGERIAGERKITVNT